MEIKNWSGKATGFLKKYRYGILVLVIGIVLMMIPTIGSKKTSTSATNATQGTSKNYDITEELTQTLSKIEGVGQVKIMLTIAAGEQVIYQENENITTSENSSNLQKETVIITGTDRQESALISYTKPPVYLGAIVVCQGADQPTVKLAVMDAVSKITGLGSDKISVVKMK